jgi:hypothetical protein
MGNWYKILITGLLCFIVGNNIYSQDINRQTTLSDDLSGRFSVFNTDSISPNRSQVAGVLVNFSTTDSVEVGDYFWGSNKKKYYIYSIDSVKNDIRYWLKVTSSDTSAFPIPKGTGYIVSHAKVYPGLPRGIPDDLAIAIGRDLFGEVSYHTITQFDSLSQLLRYEADSGEYVQLRNAHQYIVLDTGTVNTNKVIELNNGKYAHYRNQIIYFNRTDKTISLSVEGDTSTITLPNYLINIYRQQDSLYFVTFDSTYILVDSTGGTVADSVIVQGFDVFEFIYPNLRLSLSDTNQIVQIPIPFIDSINARNHIENVYKSGDSIIVETEDARYAIRDTFVDDNGVVNFTRSGDSIYLETDNGIYVLRDSFIPDTFFDDNGVIDVYKSNDTLFIETEDSIYAFKDSTINDTILKQGVDSFELQINDTLYLSLSDTNQVVKTYIPIYKALDSINLLNDSIIALRIDINNNIDSLVEHRQDIDNILDSLIAQRTDINTNTNNIQVLNDSIVQLRIDINNNIDSLIQQRIEINNVLDSLIEHRLDINILLSRDYITNVYKSGDSIIVETNQNRYAVRDTFIPDTFFDDNGIVDIYVSNDSIIIETEDSTYIFKDSTIEDTILKQGIDSLDYQNDTLYVSLSDTNQVAKTYLFFDTIQNVYKSGDSIIVSTKNDRWAVRDTFIDDNGVIDIFKSINGDTIYINTEDSLYAILDSFVTLPIFQEGSVIFSNGSEFTEDNANFYFDDSNNRLGVGTDSPLGSFHALFPNGRYQWYTNGVDVFLDVGGNSSEAGLQFFRKSGSTVLTSLSKGPGGILSGNVYQLYDGSGYASMFSTAVWVTDNTTGAEEGYWTVTTGYVNGTRALTVYRDRNIQFDGYGSGTRSGSLAYLTGFTNDGTVIEVPVSSLPDTVLVQEIDSFHYANDTLYLSLTETDQVVKVEIKAEGINNFYKSADSIILETTEQRFAVRDTFVDDNGVVTFTRSGDTIYLETDNGTYAVRDSFIPDTFFDDNGIVDTYTSNDTLYIETEDSLYAYRDSVLYVNLLDKRDSFYLTAGTTTWGVDMYPVLDTSFTYSGTGDTIFDFTWATRNYREINIAPVNFTNDTVFIKLPSSPPKRNDNMTNTINIIGATFFNGPIVVQWADSIFQRISYTKLDPSDNGGREFNTVTNDSTAYRLWNGYGWELDHRKTYTLLDKSLWHVTTSDIDAIGIDYYGQTDTLSVEDALDTLYNRNYLTDVYEIRDSLYISTVDSLYGIDLSGIDFGDIWYVADGGDNNNGVKGNPEYPLADPWAAIDSAIAGDLIIINPGTYSNSDNTKNLWKNGVSVYSLPDVIITGTRFNNPRNNAYDAYLYPLGDSESMNWYGFTTFGSTVLTLDSVSDISLDMEIYALEDGIILENGAKSNNISITLNNHDYGDLVRGEFTSGADSVVDNTITYFIDKVTAHSYWLDLNGANTNVEDRNKLNFIVNNADANNAGGDRGFIGDASVSRRWVGWNINFVINTGRFEWQSTSGDYNVFAGAMYSKNSVRNELTVDCKSCYFIGTARPAGDFYYSGFDVLFTGNYYVDLFPNYPAFALSNVQSGPAQRGLLYFNANVISKDSTAILQINSTNTQQDIIASGYFETTGGAPAINFQGGISNMTLKDLMVKVDDGDEAIRGTGGTIKLAGFHDLTTNPQIDPDINYVLVEDYLEAGDLPGTVTDFYSVGDSIYLQTADTLYGADVGLMTLDTTITHFMGGNVEYDFTYAANTYDIINISVTNTAFGDIVSVVIPDYNTGIRAKNITLSAFNIPGAVITIDGNRLSSTRFDDADTEFSNTTGSDTTYVYYTGNTYFPQAGNVYKYIASNFTGSNLWFVQSYQNESHNIAYNENEVETVNQGLDSLFNRNFIEDVSVSDDSTSIVTKDSTYRIPNSSEGFILFRNQYNNSGGKVLDTLIAVFGTSPLLIDLTTTNIRFKYTDVHVELAPIIGGADISDEIYVKLPNINSGGKLQRVILTPSSLAAASSYFAISSSSNIVSSISTMPTDQFVKYQTGVDSLISNYVNDTIRIPFNTSTIFTKVGNYQIGDVKWFVDYNTSNQETINSIQDQLDDLDGTVSDFYKDQGDAVLVTSDSTYRVNLDSLDFGNIVYFSDKNGNDLTGQRGNPAKPYKSWITAIENALSGDRIVGLSRDTFDYSSGSYYFDHNFDNYIDISFGFFEYWMQDSIYNLEFFPGTLIKGGETINFYSGSNLNMSGASLELEDSNPNRISLAVGDGGGNRGNLTLDLGKIDSKSGRVNISAIDAALNVNFEAINSTYEYEGNPLISGFRLQVENYLEDLPTIVNIENAKTPEFIFNYINDVNQYTPELVLNIKNSGINKINLAGLYSGEYEFNLTGIQNKVNFRESYSNTIVLNNVGIASEDTSAVYEVGGMAQFEGDADSNKVFINYTGRFWDNPLFHTTGLSVGGEHNTVTIHGNGRIWFRESSKIEDMALLYYEADAKKDTINISGSYLETNVPLISTDEVFDGSSSNQVKLYNTTIETWDSNFVNFLSDPITMVNVSVDYMGQGTPTSLFLDTLTYNLANVTVNYPLFGSDEDYDTHINWLANPSLEDKLKYQDVNIDGGDNVLRIGSGTPPRQIIALSRQTTQFSSTEGDVNFVAQEGTIRLQASSNEGEGIRMVNVKTANENDSIYGLLALVNGDTVMMTDPNQFTQYIIDSTDIGSKSSVHFVNGSTLFPTVYGDSTLHRIYTIATASANNVWNLDIQNPQVGTLYTIFINSTSGGGSTPYKVVFPHVPNGKYSSLVDTLVTYGNYTGGGYAAQFVYNISSLGDTAFYMVNQLVNSDFINAVVDDLGIVDADNVTYNSTTVGDQLDALTENSFSQLDTFISVSTPGNDVIDLTSLAQLYDQINLEFYGSSFNSDDDTLTIIMPSAFGPVPRRLSRIYIDGKNNDGRMFLVNGPDGSTVNFNKNDKQFDSDVRVETFHPVTNELVSVYYRNDTLELFDNNPVVINNGKDSDVWYVTSQRRNNSENIYYGNTSVKDYLDGLAGEASLTLDTVLYQGQDWNISKEFLSNYQIVNITLKGNSVVSADSTVITLPEADTLLRNTIIKITGLTVSINSLPVVYFEDSDVSYYFDIVSDNSLVDKIDDLVVSSTGSFISNGNGLVASNERFYPAGYDYIIVYKDELEAIELPGFKLTEKGYSVYKRGSSPSSYNSYYNASESTTVKNVDQALDTLFLVASALSSNAGLSRVDLTASNADLTLDSSTIANNTMVLVSHAEAINGVASSNTDISFPRAESSLATSEIFIQVYDNDPTYSVRLVGDTFQLTGVNSTSLTLETATLYRVQAVRKPSPESPNYVWRVDPLNGLVNANSVVYTGNGNTNVAEALDDLYLSGGGGGGGGSTDSDSITHNRDGFANVGINLDSLNSKIELGDPDSINFFDNAMTFFGPANDADFQGIELSQTTPQIRFDHPGSVGNVKSSLYTGGQGVNFSVNRKANTGDPWDSAYPIWHMNMNYVGDEFNIRRAPAGSSSLSYFMKIDNTGDLEFEADGDMTFVDEDFHIDADEVTQDGQRLQIVQPTGTTGGAGLTIDTRNQSGARSYTHSYWAGGSGVNYYSNWDPITNTAGDPTYASMTVNINPTGNSQQGYINMLANVGNNPFLGDTLASFQNHRASILDGETTFEDGIITMIAGGTSGYGSRAGLRVNTSGYSGDNAGFDLIAGSGGINLTANRDVVNSTAYDATLAQWVFNLNWDGDAASLDRYAPNTGTVDSIFHYYGDGSNNLYSLNAHIQNYDHYYNNIMTLKNADGSGSNMTLLTIEGDGIDLYSGIRMDQTAVGGSGTYSDIVLGTSGLNITNNYNPSSGSLVNSSDDAWSINMNGPNKRTQLTHWDGTTANSDSVWTWWPTFTNTQNSLNFLDVFETATSNGLIYSASSNFNIAANLDEVTLLTSGSLKDATKESYRMVLDVNGGAGFVFQRSPSGTLSYSNIATMDNGSIDFFTDLDMNGNTVSNIGTFGDMTINEDLLLQGSSRPAVIFNHTSAPSRATIHHDPGGALIFFSNYDDGGIDDGTKSSWLQALLPQDAGDAIIFRRRANSGSSWANKFRIENYGTYHYDSGDNELTTISLLDSNSRVGFRFFNPTSSYVSGLALGSGGNPNYLANWDPFKNEQDNTSFSSWNIVQSVNNDYTSLNRLSAGSSTWDILQRWYPDSVSVYTNLNLLAPTGERRSIRFLKDELDHTSGIEVGNGGGINLFSNWVDNAQVNVTNPSWITEVHAINDEFNVYRAPAGGSLSKQFTLDGTNANFQGNNITNAVIASSLITGFTDTTQVLRDSIQALKTRVEALEDSLTTRNARYVINNDSIDGAGNLSIYITADNQTFIFDGVTEDVTSITVYGVRPEGSVYFYFLSDCSTTITFPSEFYDRDTFLPISNVNVSGKKIMSFKEFYDGTNSEFYGK